MAPTTAPPGPSAATVDSMVAALAAQPPISLTYQQVMAAALYAGIPDDQATILTAISSVEASRNALAVSGKNLNGSRSWGAFAVTLPDNQVQDGGWMVPTVNAAQAKTQIATQGLHSWPSYASGAYLAAMGQANMAWSAVFGAVKNGPPNDDPQLLSIAMPTAVQQQLAATALQWQTGMALSPTVGAGVDAIGSLGAATAGATNQVVFKPFGSVLDFLNALGQPGTWIRIAYALIGGALIVVALRQVVAK